MDYKGGTWLPAATPEHAALHLELNHTTCAPHTSCCPAQPSYAPSLHPASHHAEETLAASSDREHEPRHLPHVPAFMRRAHKPLRTAAVQCAALLLCATMQSPPLLHTAGETLAASGNLEHEALYLALAHAAVRPAHKPLVGAALRGAAARLGYETLSAYMAGAQLALAWQWFAGGYSLEQLAALRELAAPDQAAASGGRGAYLGAVAADLVPAMLMDGRVAELREMAAALGVSCIVISYTIYHIPHNM